MRIHVEMKDIIIYALIILLAATMFVKFAKFEAAMQTSALIKTVNDHDAVIRKIVEYLNGKAVAPNTATNAPVQTPPAKKE